MSNWKMVHGKLGFLSSNPKNYIELWAKRSILYGDGSDEILQKVEEWGDVETFVNENPEYGFVILNGELYSMYGTEFNSDLDNYTRIFVENGAINFISVFYNGPSSLVEQLEKELKKVEDN